MQRDAWSILLLAILTMTGAVSLFAEESVKPEPLGVGVLFFGPSNMEPDDTAIDYKGINVGIESLTFNSPVFTQVGLNYHSWSITEKGIKHEVMMPTFSLGVSFNVFGLPTIARAMQKSLPLDLLLMAGAGASANYMPYTIKLTPAPNPKPEGYGDWKWDHAGWSYRIFAGILMDKSFGGLLEIQSYHPITGDDKFIFTDYRVGFIYNL
jgi:hypothetical protein